MALFFARSRHLVVLVLLAVALAVGELLVPAGPLGVPLDPERAAVAVYLLPMLLAIVWVICVESPSPEIENMLPGRTMRLRRLWWYAGASLLLVLAASGSLGFRFGTAMAGIVVGRAVLFGIAMATASAIVMSPRTSWIPPLTITLVLWLYGTIDQQGSPAWWAVPLYPEDSRLSAVAAVLLWATAGLLYVAFDGRAQSD